MANVEPMDIDFIESEFDNKENTHINNAVKSSGPERGFEGLDVSELNKKSRYSTAPASSTSKSYVVHSSNTLNVDTNDLFDNKNLTQSVSHIHDINTTVLKPTKLPLKVIATDTQNKGTISITQDCSTGTDNISSEVSNCDDSISCASSSLSSSTPTTPTKEIPKSMGSPIMRGLKSVWNMFRPSQSPIVSMSDDLQSTTDCIIETSALNTQVEASTPISSRNKDKSQSQSTSIFKDSVTFNEELSNELQWNNDTTIIFKEEKIPIHKLFYQDIARLPSSDSAEFFDSSINNTNHQADIKHNMSVEPMDITQNKSLVIDKTTTCIGHSTFSKTKLFNESDIDDVLFEDCEATFDNNIYNESELLKSYVLDKSLRNQKSITNELDLDDTAKDMFNNTSDTDQIHIIDTNDEDISQKLDHIPSISTVDNVKYCSTDLRYTANETGTLNDENVAEGQHDNVTTKQLTTEDIKHDIDQVCIIKNKMLDNTFEMLNEMPQTNLKIISLKSNCMSESEDTCNIIDKSIVQHRVSYTNEPIEAIVADKNKGLKDFPETVQLKENLESITYKPELISEEAINVNQSLTVSNINKTLENIYNEAEETVQDLILKENVIQSASNGTKQPVSAIKVDAIKELNNSEMIQINKSLDSITSDPELKSNEMKSWNETINGNSINETLENVFKQAEETVQGLILKENVIQNTSNVTKQIVEAIKVDTFKELNNSEMIQINKSLDSITSDPVLKSSEIKSCNETFNGNSISETLKNEQAEETINGLILKENVIQNISNVTKHPVEAIKVEESIEFNNPSDAVQLNSSLNSIITCDPVLESNELINCHETLNRNSINKALTNIFKQAEGTVQDLLLKENDSNVPKQHIEPIIVDDINKCKDLPDTVQLEENLDSMLCKSVLMSEETFHGNLNKTLGNIFKQAEETVQDMNVKEKYCNVTNQLIDDNIKTKNLSNTLKENYDINVKENHDSITTCNTVLMSEEIINCNDTLSGNINKTPDNIFKQEDETVQHMLKENFIQNFTDITEREEDSDPMNLNYTEILAHSKSDNMNLPKDYIGPAINNKSTNDTEDTKLNKYDMLKSTQYNSMLTEMEQEKRLKLQDTSDLVIDFDTLRIKESMSNAIEIKKTDVSNASINNSIIQQHIRKENNKSSKQENTQYVQNFDEVSNPFATKLKLRMSPPLTQYENKIVKPNDSLPHSSNFIQNNINGLTDCGHMVNFKRDIVNNEDLRFRTELRTPQNDLVINNDIYKEESLLLKETLQDPGLDVTVIVQGKSFIADPNIDYSRVSPIMTKQDENVTYHNPVLHSIESESSSASTELSSLVITKDDLLNLPTSSVNCLSPERSVTFSLDTTVIFKEHENSIEASNDNNACTTSSDITTVLSDCYENNMSDEVNTEDEDTLEGPFFDSDSNFQETDDNCNDKMDLNTFTDSNVAGDEKFEPGELFIDSEAFDFLMNQKGNNFVESGKESLFLKFDPLCAPKVNYCGSSLVQSVPEEEIKMSYSSTTFEDGQLGTPLDDQTTTVTQRPTMAVTPALNNTMMVRNRCETPTRINRQSMTFSSPAIAAIDQLLSLSANNSFSNHNMTVVDDTFTDPNEMEQTLLQLRQLLAEKEQSNRFLKHEQLELSNKLSTLKTKICEAQDEYDRKLERVNELNHTFIEKTKLDCNMENVMKGYEKTIAGLTTEIEENKKQHADEQMKLISERNEQVTHLENMKVTFTDLHSKYEKSKQLVLTYKTNREAYNKSVEEFHKKVQKMEMDYESHKQFASSKLNEANIELHNINLSHEAEVLKLNTMVKRKEVDIKSLDKTLKQKTKEGEELTSICDELLSKVG